MECTQSPLFKLLPLVLALGACSNTPSEVSAVPMPESPFKNLSLQCQDKSPAVATEWSSLKLELAGRYISENAFDTSSAEIVSYDSCSDRLYVVNAGNQSVDVMRLDAVSSAPSLEGQIDLLAAGEHAGIQIGAANSVAAKNGLVAVAIENAVKQLDGIIALYRSDDLSLLGTYPAGALPDMVAMTEDSRYLLSANEGEPSGDFMLDPEGSVTIVDLQVGFSRDLAKVSQIRFDQFNQGEIRHSQLAGVRLPAPHGASVAQDLEPEYLSLTDNGKVVVALQENNAMAVIDLVSGEIDHIFGLGAKSWSSAAEGGQGYRLDLTNKDGVYTQDSYPQLMGYYMPDTIASFTVKGLDYIISANEGDGREYIYETSQYHCEKAEHKWDGDAFQVGGDDENADLYKTQLGDCISYTDETRAYKLNVAADHPLMDEQRYGNKGTLANKKAIGRLKVVNDNKTIAADENIYAFGARSFSIWTVDGELVFDSGDQLATMANSDKHWNNSNDAQANDDRSDDKGVEPEAVTVAEIDGKMIAFIGLERQGGVAVYDVSKPSVPSFLDYFNNRDFSQAVCTQVNDDGECDNAEYNPAAGDLGSESITYFSRAGQHFIAVGNEVSGTTSVFKLNLQ